MMDLVTILLEAGVKSFFLLSACGACILLMRRPSAATRHMLWFFAIVGSLLCPLLNTALPNLHVLPAWFNPPPTTTANITTPPTFPMPPETRVLDDAATDASQNTPLNLQHPSSTAVLPTTTAPSSTPLSTGSAFSLDWPLVLLAIYFGGVIVTLCPLLVGYAALYRLAANARHITHTPWHQLVQEQCDRIGLHHPVVLLESAHDTSPMTWGFMPWHLLHWLRFFPAHRRSHDTPHAARILLPQHAWGWSDQQRRAVVSHELAHIKRCDCLIQLITHIACILFWFNPLIWIASRQMRIEREHACDDMVLAIGTRPSDYAQYLVHITSALHVNPFTRSCAVAMAKHVRLERRVKTILRATHNRRPLTLGSTAALLALASAMFIPITLLKPQRATSQPGTDLVTHPITYPSQQSQPYSFRTRQAESAIATPSVYPNALPTPSQAIVLNAPIRWWASHWSSRLNTAAAQVINHWPPTQKPRFLVFAPNKRKVWVKYLDLPIDSTHYPMLSLTYRATNTHRTDTSYVVYLDDTSGPDYGGLIPITHRDLIDDGQTHTLRVDLRSLTPRGNVIGLAIGVYSNDATTIDNPASFDLLDLRFESIEPVPTQHSQHSQHVYKITVRNEHGHPLPHAQVSIDAERANWARTAISDASGEAWLQPYQTQSGRHMLRVTAAGMVPVELREPATTTIAVTMTPATQYGGQIRDTNNQPIAGATLYLRAKKPTAVETQWTRTDTTVTTDAQGFWLSEPMPRSTPSITARLWHPDFTPQTDTLAIEPPSLPRVFNQTAQWTIAQHTKRITGTITTPTNQPLAHVHIGKAPRNYPFTQTNTLGAFDMEVLGTTDALIATHPDYAPTLIDISATQTEQQITVSMRPCVVLTGQIVDPDGQPIPSAAIGIRSWPSMPRAWYWQQKTDENGMFTWPNAPAGVTVRMRINTHHYEKRELDIQTPHATDPPPADKLQIELTPVQTGPTETDDHYDPFRIFRKLS